MGRVTCQTRRLSGRCNGLAQPIRRYRGAPQAALVAALNPIIRGWSLYYCACVAKRAFARIDSQVYRKLYQWAQYRHRRKSPRWRFERYWQRQGTRDAFSDGTSTPAPHEDTPILRHVKSLP
ncbi:MAG TPA: group II intron maturase-specific domain-containing protein [Anaerolineae bacterium]|nr:group II intron maturase-specific domain-containing protein [Anaerolineae bacterium]